MQQPALTLDAVLGGALPGRIHLVTGPPGSGKSAASLHFLSGAIAQRQRCACITADRATDVLALGAHVGVDVRRAVRDRRLTLLRYRKHFGARAVEYGAATEIVAELQRELGRDQTHTTDGGEGLRIVIDSIAPFLAHGAPGGAALAALAEWLDESNATAVLTWCGDVAVSVDRRIDALLDRVALIARFRRVGATTFRVEVVRARHALASAPPISFEILNGVGLVASSLFDDDRARSTLPGIFGVDPASDLDEHTA